MQTLTAVEYVRPMTGSKRPCLFICVDSEGTEIPVVVKFRESVTGNALGLVSEAICAQLGRALELSTPEPYFVSLPPGMGEFIPFRDYSAVVDASAGINFGSHLVPDGNATFPFSLQLPAQRPPWAPEVFSFDFLTQNFDRQETNHNLLFDGRTYYLIDHEQALAPIYSSSIFPPIWNVDPFFRHLFYNLLDLATNWDIFYIKFRKISNARIDRWFHELPQEWLARHQEIDKMKGYLIWLSSSLDQMDTAMKSILSPT